MIKELDIVILTRDLNEYHLPQGSRGAVVHCYGDGQGFEVEFPDEAIADSFQVLTLERSDIQLERSAVQAEVIALLDSLPEDLLAEVRDFAAFLQHKHRYDVSWSVSL